METVEERASGRGPLDEQPFDVLSSKKDDLPESEGMMQLSFNEDSVRPFLMQPTLKFI
jgi:hypothetical protein